MKTKRRALIVAVGVVTLAILACLPLASDAYEWLAYDNSDALYEYGPDPKHPRGVDRSAIPFGSRPAKKLRWSWLPGPLFVFDELCYRCMKEAHEQCRRENSQAFDIHPDGDTLFRKQYTCNCPNPSHEKDKP